MKTILSLAMLFVELKTDSFSLNDIFEIAFEVSARLLQSRFTSGKITQIEKKQKISI